MMKPPIESIGDRVEVARILNQCIDDTAYFAEQFLGHDVYDYNKVYLNCHDRFIVYRTGRQVGKTRNTAVKAIHFGYFAPLMADNIDDEATILLTSHSEDQARIMFKEIKKNINRSEYLTKALISETKTELWLKFFDGSGTAHFIVRPTGDAGDSVRGYTSNLIIVDESAYVPEKVYSALLPSGSAVKAKVYLTSTPAERAGVFYEACENSHTLYEKGVKQPPKEKKDSNIWTQFHVKSYDNPTTAGDPIFLDMVRKMSKTKQRAEIEGEFLEAGSSLFSYDLLEDAFKLIDTTGLDIDYYTLGVDTSGKGDDETVLADIAVTKDGLCFPVEIYTEDTTDQTKLARVIEDKYRRRHYRTIYVDGTGLGDGLVDACKHLKTPLPIRAINFKSEKTDMYNGLVILFENRGINFSKFPTQYIDKARRQFQYLYADYGKNRDGTARIRTHDDHDDIPDAIALGCYDKYGGEGWYEMPPDIMDPDLAPDILKKDEEEEPYYLGSLRMS